MPVFPQDNVENGENWILETEIIKEIIGMIIRQFAGENAKMK